MTDMFIKNVLNENMPVQDVSPMQLTPKFKKVKPYEHKLISSFTYNGKKYNRLLIIGDIHGMYNKFLDVLSKAQITDNDLLISLGDYTDRGNQNIKCMQALIALNTQPNCITLLGNHEWMLIDHFVYITQKVMREAILPTNFDKVPLNKWMIIIDYMRNYYYSDNIYTVNGGRITLDEINQNNIKIFIEYLKTIFKLPLMIRMNIDNKQFIFTHAGIDPSKPIDQQTMHDLIWIRKQFFMHYKGDMVICVGHTPTPALHDNLLFEDNNEEAVPYYIDNMIFADTGSFWPEGRITIIDVLNHNYWQSTNQ